MMHSATSRLWQLSHGTSSRRGCLADSFCFDVMKSIYIQTKLVRGQWIELFDVIWHLIINATCLMLLMLLYYK